MRQLRLPALVSIARACLALTLTLVLVFVFRLSVLTLKLTGRGLQYAAQAACMMMQQLLEFAGGLLEQLLFGDIVAAVAPASGA